MAVKSKKSSPAAALSGGDDPIIVKGDGTGKAVAKKRYSEASLSGGDDPIIVKGDGTGQAVASRNGAKAHRITITLDTEENMGWKIVKGEGVTVIIIDEETAAWKVKTSNKKKIYLERQGKAITGIDVANMVDGRENDVPRKQKTKQEKYPAIEIYTKE